MRSLAAPLVVLTFCALTARAQTRPPVITGIELNDPRHLVVRAEVPPGYRHVVLEANRSLELEPWEAMIAGPLDGEHAAALTFHFPDPGPFALVRVRMGIEEAVPEARHQAGEGLGSIHGEFLIAKEMEDPDPDPGDGDDPGPDPAENGENPAPRTETEKIGHLLNRVTYGPTPEAFDKVASMGIAAYVESQLRPESIDETGDPRLTAKTAPYFLNSVPGEETDLIPEGAVWKFFRGTREPPSNWREIEFSDIFWEAGRVGIGYGDDDDRTVLEDMRGDGGYLSLYARHRFSVDDPQALENLTLRLRYDDSFVAYLNGQEIARANLSGSPPAFDTRASNAGGNVDNEELPGEFAVVNWHEHLREGVNVLAVQVHNANLTSSDLSFAPLLYHAPAPSYQAIRGIDALQQLVHAEGIYSERQLQAVLTDFWENHFTTDYHKLRDYLEELEAYEKRMTSDAEEARLERQIAVEAAQMEFQEYRFFREHALGHFGDLLLYSATSPAMLIYLDNVLNGKEEPNENYAREILELYAFGADNRYSQSDIETLARCFTGWSIRKVRPESLKPFPESARQPYLTPSLAIEEEISLVDLGPGWRYFKGEQEPSPDLEGNPTMAWAQPEFSDVFWAEGVTGLGYGDGDDATVLSDMRNGYLSVYARRHFQWDPETPIDGVVLDVAYDDGYVAYLNGEEIARSRSMRDYGSPPPYDRESRSHEADDGNDVIFLETFQHLLRPAPETNVLAFQVHNRDLNSSDLTLAPRVVMRRYNEDSVDEASPAGLWTFRFNPDEHDGGEKLLFEGTEHEIRLPGGREGGAGVNDAIEVIDRMASHPSTREFIVIKLVNKLVSDEITLDSFHDGTAPPELIDLVDRGMAAWQSTPRPGHIGTVVRALIDPEDQAGPFWSGIAYRSKVKSAIEFIHSAMRALDAELVNERLPEVNEDIGMTIFERDDPDGFPEVGEGWMDTRGLLERVKFGQALTRGLGRSGADWNPVTYFQAYGLTTPESLIDHFDRYFFQGHLHEDHRAVLLEFANTDEACEPSPWQSQNAATRRDRMRDLMALLLASPDFHMQ